MSLAMYAAPFDDNLNNNNDNIIHKKRQTHNHNKTQKMYNKESFTPSTNFDKNKVNSVLEEIHNNTEDSNYEMENNFDPPPKPQSSGVQKTLTNEAMQNMMNQNNMNNMNMYKVLGKSPQPNYHDENNLELNELVVDWANNTKDKSLKNVLLAYSGKPAIPNEHNTLIIKMRNKKFC